MDTRLQTVIVLILRGGVISSLLLIVLGIVLGVTDRAFIPNIADIVNGLVKLHGEAFIATGLLLLIMTPIARVVASLITFALSKDHVFSIITTVVLLVLLTSFFIGTTAG